MSSPSTFSMFSSSTFLRDNWHGLAIALTVFYLSISTMKFIKRRRFYRNLPTPPYSLLLGNLKIMGEEVKKYPADFHPQPLFTNLENKYGFDGIYYMDMYPAADPLIFISDPDLAHRIQTSPNIYRHSYAINFLGGIVGTKSLFSTHGAEWSKQRGWFSPAFSMASILDLVPGMIKETLVFKKRLEGLSESGEVFSLNQMTMELTIDVIGRSVGDIELGSQTKRSEIFAAFVNSLHWTAGLTDPFWKLWASPVMMWWYVRKLDRALGEVIQQKFREKMDLGERKTILDLAWKGYSKEMGLDGKSSRADLDKEFMKIALDNAKVFFAAGHDTTSSLITYTFYYLSIHPSILSRVREEHKAILGNTFETTVEALQSSPHLLNKLPLTSAVHKEVLRLHPVGFTIRGAAPGTTVTHNGRTYPLSNHMISILSASMHRNPSYFSNPQIFDPDRWLTSENPDAGVSNGAWQPFERGPRNCIGQQLALIEARVVAALIVRWFDFEAVFKDHGLSVEGWGGRAYQEVKTTAKPKDGIPSRVRKRSNVK